MLTLEEEALQSAVFIKNANFAPLCSFEQIKLWQANACLTAWGHKMGAFTRPNGYTRCYALFYNDRPVAVTVASQLVAARVGGGLDYLTRSSTVELARLCAEKPGLCRVALRMWREFVFPMLDFQYAVSYQDADLHNGNTYRFDGWIKLGFARSGPDTRSGRPGRNKWIWGWGMDKKEAISE